MSRIRQGLFSGKFSRYLDSNNIKIKDAKVISNKSSIGKKFPIGLGLGAGLLAYGLQKKKSNGKDKVISTSGGIGEFDRNRRYDTDMNKLSKGSFQNESNTNQLNTELDKSRKELKLS